MKLKIDFLNHWLPCHDQRCCFTVKGLFLLHTHSLSLSHTHTHRCISYNIICSFQGICQKIGQARLVRRGGNLSLNLSAVFSYRVYQVFGQALLCYGGLVQGSSQYQVMIELPKELLLTLKVVNINTKILICLILPCSSI